MNAVQLEFTLEHEEKKECPIECLKNKVDEAVESMGKVRKKLFAKMSEVEKMCISLKTENEHLKSLLGVENVSIKADEEEGIRVDA